MRQGCNLIQSDLIRYTRDEIRYNLIQSNLIKYERDEAELQFIKRPPVESDTVWLVSVRPGVHPD